MTVVDLDTRRLRGNRRLIDQWLWMARHHVRKGNVRGACEAMLSALWLMGVEQKGEPAWTSGPMTERETGGTQWD